MTTIINIVNILLWGPPFDVRFCENLTSKGGPLIGDSHNKSLSLRREGHYQTATRFYCGMNDVTFHPGVRRVSGGGRGGLGNQISCLTGCLGWSQDPYQPNRRLSAFGVLLLGQRRQSASIVPVVNSIYYMSNGLTFEIR